VDGQIAAAPDYLAHQYWRGSALYDLSRWSEALDQFESLLRADSASTSYRGMAAVAAARVGDRTRAEHHLLEAHWGYEVADRLVYAARVAAVLGDMDRSLARLSEALDRGSAGFPWMHASGRHDFVVLRSDPRIARLLEPDS